MPDSVIAKIIKPEIFDFVKIRERYVNPDPEVPAQKNYKISLCTTCMDRLDDLMKTLPKNMEDNYYKETKSEGSNLSNSWGYPNVEFVLLNYGSKKDNIGNWIKNQWKDSKSIIDHRLEYFEFVPGTEPKTYSMAHSRNVAFKAASGDIVLNVDADNYTNVGFASFINVCANQYPHKTAFVKGKQLLRGRVGFFKQEFVNLLGGYDEGFDGYGYDDLDIVTRALFAGFIGVCHGGQFVGWVKDHKKHESMENYKNPDWKYTQRKNQLISYLNIFSGRYKVNEGMHWGRAKLIKNFKEEIEL